MVAVEPLPAPLPWPGRRQVARALVRWSLICGVAAVPSFLCGWSGYQPLVRGTAMMFGVACIVVLYTYLDVYFVAGLVRGNAALRVTLWITYAARILISLVYHWA